MLNNIFRSYCLDKRVNINNPYILGKNANKQQGRLPKLREGQTKLTTERCLRNTPKLYSKSSNA